MLKSGQIFSLDDIRVDVADQSVTRGANAVRMPPRVFQTLVILLEASPRMIPKAELYRALWPDTVVDESGLAQNIHLLRKLLGPRPDGGEYVETVPKRGYRLTGTVIREAPAPAPAAVAEAARSRRWLAIFAASAVIAGALAWVAARPALNRHVPDPQAVRLTKMGQEVWRNTLQATPAEEQEFRQAIQLDPGYAPAYVGLATVEATASGVQAEALVAQALRIDPNSSDAHAVAAFIAMIHQWDWDRARREFERAIALDPRNTAARRWYSMYFSFRGEHAAAAEQINAALQIEPGSASLLMQRCSQLAYEDKFDAAMESCQAALRVQPRFHRAHARLFQIYGTLGNAELAARHLVLALDPENVESAEALAPRLALAAHARGLAGVLEDHLHSTDPYSRAEATAMLRDRTGTLANLRQAVANRGFFSAFIRAEPMFHFLYGDAEFNGLLRKIGLPSSDNGATTAALM